MGEKPCGSCKLDCKDPGGQENALYDAFYARKRKLMGDHEERQSELGEAAVRADEHVYLPQ